MVKLTSYKIHTRVFAALRAVKSKPYKAVIVA